MTRINKIPTFFKPHALQPIGFFDQGRTRAFAGNHPTESHRRVHFNSDNDSQRLWREEAFDTSVRTYISGLSSEFYNERLNAGIELVKLSKQGKCLSKYNLEEIKSNDRGVKILVLYAALKSLDNQSNSTKVAEKRQNLLHQITFNINSLLPQLKEKLKSDKPDDKIEATTYLRYLCEISGLNIEEAFTGLEEILKSDNETLIDNATYVLGTFAMHGGNINKFLDQLAEILEKTENTEIKINCLRGMTGISLHRVNIKKHIPTISKYITYPSEMVSHLAINTLFHYSKNGGDISHTVKDLESAAFGVNREMALSTLVSHIDNLTAPWYIRLYRYFTS